VDAHRVTTYPNTPFVLSLIAIALLLVSGWLGGQMVYVHQVAVSTDDEPAFRVTGSRDVRGTEGQHAKA
jgi:predicted membrane protein DUF2231